MNEKLQLFHDRIERLKSNKDFFVSSRVNMKYEKDRGIYTTFTGPDLKTIKAFLLDFRPFILNDEPVNFEHISNLLYKSVNEDAVKADIAKAKEEWAKLLENKKSAPLGGLQLIIDGEKLLSNKNLDLWLNSEYFHLDEEKRNLLERINSNPIGQLSHFVFIDLLQRLSQLLFWFDERVVGRLLNKDS